jgi:hypothetical protein
MDATYLEKYMYIYNVDVDGLCQLSYIYIYIGKLLSTPTCSYSHG